MPPKNKTTAATARPERNAKKVLSPEEAKHQAALEAIKNAFTVPAAQVQWTDLRDRVNALVQKKQELDEEHRRVDKLRTKAAADQDYVAAQTHKTKQEALVQERALIETQIQPLAELRDAAKAHYSEKFLADEKAPFNRPERVTLYRIQVINPLTQNFESVHYMDSCDTVSMSLDGQHFESEAYNLSSWAEEKGFIARRDERPIEF